MLLIGFQQFFIDVENEMRGLEWGRLYELYHKQGYDSKKVSEEVKNYMAIRM